jgi:hypothetical protein
VQKEVQDWLVSPPCALTIAARGYFNAYDENLQAEFAKAFDALPLETVWQRCTGTCMILMVAGPLESVVR